MNEKGTDRLLAAVEERADILLGLLQAFRQDDAALRARLAELEAQRRELAEENRELDEQNRELEEHNRELHDRLSSAQPEPTPAPAPRRARGLSALMRHRPRATPPSEVDTTVQPAEASQSPSDPSGVETPRMPFGEEQGEESLSPSDPPGGEVPSPQALLDQWYRRYEATFFRGHTRPLKVGIHRELAEREAWPEKLVRRALACYVNLPRYLKSVRDGAERIDLDGQAVDKVDPAAADHARRRLERLQAERLGRKRQTSRRKSPVDERAENTARPAPAMESAPDRAPSGSREPSSRKPRGPSLEPSTASETPAPATLEDKLSALMAKHNGR